MAITRKYILLIILLVLAAYSNSFQNEFVWDDEFLIVENPAAMSWEYAWTHFALDLYHSFSNYYRPIQMITYMIDFSLWQLNPFGYHLTNVLLHIFVCLSFFTLLQLMSGDKRIAFAGAVFYAVHPAHTAVVTYIAGRADSLATFFLLLSLILFHRHFKIQARMAAVFLYISSLICFLLALLSKEMAIIFPLIILFYRLFFINDNEVEKSKSIIKFHYLSWFIIMAGVYIILRIYALNFQEGLLFQSKYPLYLRLLTFLKALGIYFVIILFPMHLYMERDISYALSFFETEVLLSALLFLFILWLVIRMHKISKQASFGFLFSLIALIPVMNICPLSNNMAEHWLYIPMLGISMFLLCLGIKAWDVKRAFRPLLLSIFILYVAFLSVKTFYRNFDWKDKYTIYAHTYVYNPRSIKILNNLGNLYLAEGNFNMAMIFHNKAIEINPREYRTYYNLARDYEKMGMQDRALEQYKKSVQLRPNYAKAYFEIGNIYAQRKKLEMAAKAYKQAVRYDEFHIGAHTNLGNIYFDAGDYQRAKELYEKAIQINPHLPDIHNNRGNTLSKLGLYSEAVEEHKKAIELAPEEAEYHLSLGITYGELRMYDKAVGELRQAHRLKPRDTETLLNLGTAYYYKGDIVSAKKEWQKALKINPENDIAINYLKKIQNQ